MPEEFSATLFAAEPMVRQPISMAFDERGRMWVVECDSYSDREENFSDAVHDRVVILADRDGDGRAETRTVFWDQGRRTTSAVPGFGGVWVLDAPRLLFFPDANRDDVPDGPPDVVLDGFNDNEVRHNIVNGLLWGPDGWLYGRHGILATSYVGAPGAPDETRTPLNCGVWRIHPVRRTFEVVSVGTTNPWGLDYDAHGELLMINTVIGHLWHVVPGAHFQRMYGADFDPYVYKLLPQSADHYHWDVAEKWSDIRETGVTPTTDAAGGGHAHCGLMIYLGDNWPAEHRGRLFTVNLHGRRINSDSLHREGCRIVGRHAEDLLRTDDEWFRGIELVYGPDGGVYLADWSDIGECHENDGIHRTSGRIFKFTYNMSATAPPAEFDLGEESNEQLLDRLSAENEYWVRQSRRLLQERAARSPEEARALAAALRAMLTRAADSRRQVGVLLALHVVGGLDFESLNELLQAPVGQVEPVRAWLVRLMAEMGPADRASRVLADVARQERSGLVRLHLASGLQRWPVQHRWQVAMALAAHGEDADDPWQPLMVWYGLRDAVLADPERALEAARTSRLPVVSELIVRRLIQGLPDNDSRRGGLAALARELNGESRRSVLRGLHAGLQGVRRAPAPAGWDELVETVRLSGDAAAEALTRDLGAVLGEGRALEELRTIAAAADQVPAVREAAIRSLVEARDPECAELLTGLLADRDVVVAAIRGLAAVGAPGAAERLLEAYPRMSRAGRDEAFAALCSRPGWTAELLVAAAAGRIDRGEAPAFALRQAMSLGDARLSDEINRLWPELRKSSEERQARRRELQQQLTADRLSQAALPSGRKLFDVHCAKCHKLFGEGGATAPDLTGAQRSNLSYLLENILDPSLNVSTGFRMSIAATVDGRVLNGVVTSRTEQALELQTATEKLTLPVAEIDELRETNLSLMPEGLLDRLSDDELRDLMGYLMSPVQSPRAD